VHDVQRRVRQNNYRAGNAAQVVTFNRVTTLQCRTTVSQSFNQRVDHLQARAYIQPYG